LRKLRLQPEVRGAGTGTGRPWYFRDPGPNRRPSVAVVTALALVLAMHVGVGAYVAQSKFEAHFREFAEQVAEVELVRPALPEPPPPPPKAEKPQLKTSSALPTLQPRPPAAVALGTPPPPLPVPPVPEREEMPGPAAIGPAPLSEPTPVLAAPRPSPVITNPDWLRRPSAAEIARYYPDRAARLGVEGRALISCGVSAEGRLEACVVAEEKPADQGFGDAAVKMSRHFVLRPMTRDGVAVSGGTIRIPIRFALAA
jgi:protein TonB